MSKTIIVSEDAIIAQMLDFLTECDRDELARLTGEIFGGECCYFPDGYHFYPDAENYYGAFGEAEND
jgi:hypothetical protein